MRRVGVVAKKSLKNAECVFTSLRIWLEKRGLEVFFDEDTAEKIAHPVKSLRWEEFSGKVDWMVVLGGDGTFLRAVRHLHNMQVPILGVNFGSLGFLTEVPLEDMFYNIDCIIKGKFEVEERTFLKVQICRNTKIISTHYALNEVVFTKGTLARIIELDASIDNLFINTFHADGLIISTPTGSTAYSLSAGGPILFPKLDALIITPICPHTLTNRPIVIPDTGVVRISLKSENEVVFLTVDGQVGLKMKHGDIAEMQKASHSLLMIQPREKNYYEVIRSKLGWGKGVKKQNINDKKKGIEKLLGASNKV